MPYSLSNKLPSYDTAIIGAGTAGCMLARSLSDAGQNILLVDKSRGLGGRCSRRRLTTGGGVDLGAADAMLAGSAFEETYGRAPLADLWAQWSADGLFTPWTKRRETGDPHTQEVRALSPAPAMSQWHKTMAGHIPLLSQTRIKTLRPTGDGWQLIDTEHREAAQARRVVVAMPYEQAQDLLRDHGVMNHLPPSSSRPQYTCALGFAEPTGITADEVHGSIIASATRENSKPGRSSEGYAEVWVVHSSHDFAEAQDHCKEPLVWQELAAAFCEHPGLRNSLRHSPDILTTHYWRFARHPGYRLAPEPFLWNSEKNLGCIGDWLTSGDFAGAVYSAQQLAHALR